MSKVKYVASVLALTALSLAAIMINPATTWNAIKADKVAGHVHNLMYPGYTGKVLVNYDADTYTPGDLAEIKAFGFDGVIVPQDAARLVMILAPNGLAVLAKGPADQNLHITVPVDQGPCGAAYWKSYWSVRHAVFTSSAPVEAIEVDSWQQVKQGITNCSSLTATVNHSSLEFSVGKAPIPTIDHYEVYLSKDHQHFEKLIDLSPTATALDMSRLALSSGTYWLLVKEVAIPLYRNDVSNEVIYQPR